MGDPLAIEQLQGAESPDSVAYLLRWADDIARGRTMGPHAVNGFTWEMVTAWAKAMDVSPLPHEIDALMTLDVLMRFPNAGQEDET